MILKNIRIGMILILMFGHLQSVAYASEINDSHTIRLSMGASGPSIMPGPTNFIVGKGREQIINTNLGNVRLGDYNDLFTKVRLIITYLSLGGSVDIGNGTLKDINEAAKYIKGKMYPNTQDYKNCTNKDILAQKELFMKKYISDLKATLMETQGYLEMKSQVANQCESRMDLEKSKGKRRVEQ